MARERKKRPFLWEVPNFKKQAEEIRRYVEWRESTRSEVNLKAILDEVCDGNKARSTFLQRIIYWHVDDSGITRMTYEGPRGSGRLFLVKGDKDWLAEIGISSRSISRYKERLAKLGLISVELHRSALHTSAPTSHYNLDFGRLLEVIADGLRTHLVRVGDPDTGYGRRVTHKEILGWLKALHSLRDLLDLPDPDLARVLVSRHERMEGTAQGSGDAVKYASDFRELGCPFVPEWQSLDPTATPQEPSGDSQGLEPAWREGVRQDGAMHTQQATLQQPQYLNRGEDDTATSSQSSRGGSTPKSTDGEDGGSIRHSDAVPYTPNTTEVRRVLVYCFDGRLRRWAFPQAPSVSNDEIGALHKENLSVEGNDQAGDAMEMRRVVLQAWRDAMDLAPRSLPASVVGSVFDRRSRARGPWRAYDLMLTAAASACGRMEGHSASEVLSHLISPDDAVVEEIRHLQWPSDSHLDDKVALRRALYTVCDSVTERSLGYLLRSVCRKSGSDAAYMADLFSLCGVLVNRTRTGAHWNKGHFVEALVAAGWAGGELQVFIETVLNQLPVEQEETLASLLWYLRNKNVVLQEVDLEQVIDEPFRGG